MKKLLLLSLYVALLSQLLLTLFSSCERRPLEVIVDEKVKVRIIVKWKINFVELYGGTPNGMTVMIWNANGGAPIIRTTNADNITVALEPATYHMAIFNELMDDYAPYLRFYDTGSYDLMTCRATTFTVDGVTRGWDDGTTYMYTPEDPRIAVALDTFEITRQMVLQDTSIFIPYEEYRDNGYVNYRESEHVFEIPETPWPMTVDLYVELKLKNYHSLATINGSISGMADGFYMSHINRTAESGTIRFSPDQWTRYRYQYEEGNTSDSLGIISTRVASFGLPYGKELLANRLPTDNVLKLNFLLTNDSVISAEYNVGDIIRYITPEGREAQIRYRQDLQNLKLEMVLPDIIPLPWVFPKGGAGFDATVDDWEDGGTIDLGGF